MEVDHAHRGARKWRPNVGRTLAVFPRTDLAPDGLLVPGDWLPHWVTDQDRYRARATNHGHRWVQVCVTADSVPPADMMLVCPVGIRSESRVDRPASGSNLEPRDVRCCPSHVNNQIRPYTIRVPDPPLHGV